MKKFFMLSTAIGAMTAAERSVGRYMRAPDHEGDPFAELNATGGEIEVGATKDAIETNIPEPEPAKKGGGTGKPPREKAADKAATDKAAGKEAPGDDEDKSKLAEEPGEEDDDEDEEDDDEENAAKKQEGHLKRLKRERMQAKAENRELKARLAALESGPLAQRLERLEKGLQGGNSGGNPSDIGKAPDPLDAAKYPLGHLDDRYIEDKLDFLASQKAAERADAVLQRQQEGERQAQAQKAHAELLEKVDDLSTRGSEIFDDFQESVVDAGLRGDWRLDQPTFEAAHEAENGAQILYELSQNKIEAARVAGLSSFQQVAYVVKRDAEISAKSKPRTKPGAGEPPQTRTKGANSSHRINPATENLDDFEKAWAADAKG